MDKCYSGDRISEDHLQTLILRNQTRRTALERSVIDYLGGSEGRRGGRIKGLSLKMKHHVYFFSSDFVCLYSSVNINAYA